MENKFDNLFLKISTTVDLKICIFCSIKWNFSLKLERNHGFNLFRNIALGYWLYQGKGGDGRLSMENHVLTGGIKFTAGNITMHALH